MYGSITVHTGMPQIEARATAPNDPEDTGSAHAGALATAFWQLGVSDIWGEQYINHDTALTYSAVWACVRVIAESLSGVGWHAFERKPENPRFRFPILDDIAYILQLQANPETSAFDWRQVMLKDALLWGNGYAEIERTNSGKPMWLWQIHPSRVEVIRDGSQLLYKVDNGTGKTPTYLRPENVFHLKGIGPDGVVGWSVVEMARKSIQLGLQEERFGNDFFSRGIMPGGVITIPGHTTKEARKEFRKGFEELYAGRAAHHRVVVVSDGVTFTPATLPNNDAQFLESRTFQVQEICRWYGVPPHKLADLIRATFSNIEEQERAFVTDCLLPWARRLESEADIKLFGPVKRGRRFTRLNLDALMRGNSQTQTETVTKKVAAGLLTLDEGREYFDLNPHEDSLGETPLIQGAMVPLASVLGSQDQDGTGEGSTGGDKAELAANQALTLQRLYLSVNSPKPLLSADEARAIANRAGAQLTGPAPEPDPEAPPAEPQPDDDPAAPRTDPEAIRRVFGCLLVDVYSRLLHVDADKAKRAANKGKLSEHIAEWYAEPAAVERVKGLLLPTFHALGIVLSWPSAEADSAAESAAAWHVTKCKRELSGGYVEDWSTWPAEAVERIMKGIFA